MKPTTPGSLSRIICLCDLFFFAFIFRSTKPKTQKYLTAIYSYLFIWHSIYQFTTNLPHVCLPILRRRTPKGIDNPFNTLGREWMLFVCRGCLRCVAWFSYWFDNLGFISEGNTCRRCATSSLPLWGNTDVVLADIKRNFRHRCQGGSSTYTRFLITNLISSQFTLFAICLSFSSLPLHKILPFYLPYFSFAFFSLDLLFACVTLCPLFACIFAC